MQQLKSELNKIGWDIKGRYPNQYIFNHENKNTGYQVYNDRVEVSNRELHSSIVFTFKGSTINNIDGDCVAFGTDECFMLFQNFGIKTKGVDNPLLK